MELSTSIPMPRDRPASVNNIHIQTGEVHEHHANSTDRGILTPTTSVGLTSFRKMASTTMASAAPTSILVRMLLMRMLM